MHPALRRLIFLVLLPVVLLGGCSRKEVTELERKQAAALASEADLAVNLRDYTRAEGLLAQAVALCPDAGNYWLSLGMTRRKLDNRAGAKKAYEQALDLTRDAYKRNRQDPQPLLQQVYLLALLGRVDDARDTQEKAQKDHPNDRNVHIFVENRQLDRLTADPGFKAMAL
jgi:tetratricopeptide (TPR) repeat protein